MQTVRIPRFALRSRVIAAIVVAGLLVGTNAASANPVTAVSTTPALTFHTVNPARVLDTRTGMGAPHTPLSANRATTLTIPEIPANATAATLNVTAVNGTNASYLTLYAKGAPTSATPTINWANQSAANGAVVALGDDHTITISNRVGAVDVVIDLIGYYSPGRACAVGAPGAKDPVGATGPAETKAPRATPAPPGRQPLRLHFCRPPQRPVSNSRPETRCSSNRQD